MDMSINDLVYALVDFECTPIVYLILIVTGYSILESRFNLPILRWFFIKNKRIKNVYISALVLVALINIPIMLLIYDYNAGLSRGLKARDTYGIFPAYLSLAIYLPLYIYDKLLIVLAFIKSRNTWDDYTSDDRNSTDNTKH